MRSFLSECACHDWRRDYSVVDGSAVAAAMQAATVEDVQLSCRISSVQDLRSRIRSASGPDADEGGVVWFADKLLVAQMGAALNGLVNRQYDTFAHDSVPDGVLWRKNAAVDWPCQCLPERYGWFSDSASLRDLFEKLLRDRSAVSFCDTMGFTRVEGKENSGYGPMFFMFYTERQLQDLEQRAGIEWFRPFWPVVSDRLRRRFQTRRDGGMLESSLPSIWERDISKWEQALAIFGEEVKSLTDDESRIRFLDFAITECKPLWDGDTAPASLDPSEHPVAAARHLLDNWYGANHLFMGDGFTWSEDRVKGHAEYLVSSFENFDSDRVSIFPLKHA